jgi:hypothetical protein
MRKSIKMVFGVMLGSLALVGCMTDSSNNPSSREEGFATVGLSLKTSAVNAASSAGLSKGASFDSLRIDSLFIKLTSEGPSVTGTLDTIILALEAGSSTLTLQYKNKVGDSLAAVLRNGLNEQLKANAYEAQPFTGLELNLRALRDWKIEVGTISAEGDTLQLGDTTYTQLFAGQKQTGALDVNPLFKSYQANFNFPGYVTSASSSDSQTLNITRVRFFLDSTAGGLRQVVDSSATKFDSATAHAVVYSAKSDSLSAYDSLLVRVYGKLPQANPIDTTDWTQEQVLYEVKVSLAELHGTNPLAKTLVWKGPVRGAVTASFSIGAVNLYILAAETEGEVLDKK